MNDLQKISKCKREVPKNSFAESCFLKAAVNLHVLETNITSQFSSSSHNVNDCEVVILHMTLLYYSMDSFVVRND